MRSAVAVSIPPAATRSFSSGSEIGMAVPRQEHSVTLRAMLAREIMIPEPFVAAAGATSSEVALLMRAKDISVVPVVDNPKDRRYLGTISDRDIVTGCVAAGRDPKTCKVRTHARQDTEVVTLDTELEGYRIERVDEKEKHIRSTIVVVDGNKRVVGFIPHPEFIQGIVIVRE